MALKLNPVLVLDLEVTKIANFLLFDALDPVTLLFDSFALLLTVLQVVEASLLFDFLVLADLKLQGLFVSLKSFLLLSFQLTLPLLIQLLLLNNTTELSTAEVCLLG